MKRQTVRYLRSRLVSAQVPAFADVYFRLISRDVFHVSLTLGEPMEDRKE